MDPILEEYFSTPIFDEIVRDIMNDVELSEDKQKFYDEVISMPLHADLKNWNQYAKYYSMVLHPEENR
jgi:hypothetical protein